MEGIYFYWLAWAAWIITTFFMKKDGYRLQLSIIILLIITLSLTNFSLFGIKINLAMIIALLFCYFLIRKKKLKSIVYLLVCTLTITIAYVTFLLFEIFDPIWIVFDRRIMLSVCLLFLCLTLVKEPVSRVSTLVIATCHGELLFAFILKRLGFTYEVGSLQFLETTSIAISFTYVWILFESLVKYFDPTYLKNSKEKQG
ncbi:hypothetical protein LCL95_05695 [Bacillus timonensis]|nr:hypothetical protein [Bacillus timonensis]